MGKIVIKCFTR